MSRQLDVAIGRNASIAAAIETILFAVSLILGLSIRSNLGPIPGYVVCIFLAASIVVMMACIYSRTLEEWRILGLLALAAPIISGIFRSNSDQPIPILFARLFSRYERG